MLPVFNADSPLGKCFALGLKVTRINQNAPLFPFLLFIFFERQRERDKLDKGKAFSSIDSFPKYPQQLGLDQGPESHSGSPTWVAGTQVLELQPPRVCISRKLHGSWGSGIWYKMWASQAAPEPLCQTPGPVLVSLRSLVDFREEP